MNHDAPSDRLWPRVLKNSDFGEYSMSAYGSSGIFRSVPVQCRVGFCCLGCLLRLMCMGSGDQRSRWRSDDVFRQPFEVLDGGGRQEFVAS